MKSSVRIFGVREEPRQRPGGGKGPEIVKRSERSPQSLPSQDKISGGRVRVRWCWTSQAMMGELSLVYIQGAVPGRFKWGPT